MKFFRYSDKNREKGEAEREEKEKEEKEEKEEKDLFKRFLLEMRRYVSVNTGNSIGNKRKATLGFLPLSTLKIFIKFLS